MKEGTEVLDRTSEIAKEQMASMEDKEASDKEAADKEAKEEGTGESKGASDGSSSTEDKKTEEEKKAEAEATAKEEEKVANEELLKTEDKDLSEEQLEKKQKLVEVEEEAKKSPEQKLQEWQDKTQKRIDGLVGELKENKEGRGKDAETIAKLEATIDGLQGNLENSGTIESEKDKIAKSNEGLYAKMIEEDGELPRNKRREMSKDELEEYLVEDYVEANEWLAERTLRRREDQDKKTQLKDNTAEIRKNAETLFDKYPDCNPEVRSKELAAEGKTEKEAFNILLTENEDFKLMMDIAKEKPELMDMNNPQAPLKMMEEIGKRKGVEKKGETKMLTPEDAQKLADEAVAKENARRDSIDQGLSNSGVVSKDTRTPEYKEGLTLFIKAGARKGQTWTEKDYQETLEYGNRQRKAHPN